MTTLPATQPFNAVVYLVRRKFPMLNWRERYGPGSGVRSSRSAGLAPVSTAELRESAEAYEAELLAMQPEAIALLLVDEQRKEAAERLFAAQREEASHFYNRPDANADFSYWAKQSYWTVDEAVALSFGKNPKKVSWETLKSCTQVWPFAKHYEDRLDQFNRAVWAEQIFSQTYPSLFLAWAGRMGFAMPPDLILEVEALGIQIADWKTLYDKRVEELRLVRLELAEAKERCAPVGPAPEAPSPSAPKEELGEKGRGTFQRMILGMAMEQYGYDPNEKKSAVPRQIASDLALHGFALAEKTIRDHLRAAAERFPEGDR